MDEKENSAVVSDDTDATELVDVELAGKIVDALAQVRAEVTKLHNEVLAHEFVLGLLVATLDHKRILQDFRQVLDRLSDPRRLGGDELTREVLRKVLERQIFIMSRDSDGKSS